MGGGSQPEAGERRAPRESEEETEKSRDNVVARVCPSAGRRAIERAHLRIVEEVLEGAARVVELQQRHRVVVVHREARNVLLERGGGVRTVALRGEI